MTTGSNKGFTLVEMLVAAAVFSVLAVSLAASLRQGLETWRRLEQEGRARRLARGLFSDLSRELRHAVPFPGKATVVEEKRLLFYTVMAPHPEAKEGLFQVEYKLSHEAALRENGEGPFLEKTVLPMGLSESSDKSVALLTHEPTSTLWEVPRASRDEKTAVDWRSSWPLEDRLPAGIRLKISFAGKGDTFQRVFDVPGGVLAPPVEVPK